MTVSEQKAVGDLKVQIRVVMARRDMTIKDLAKACGTSPQLMGKWLRNPERLTMDKWATINRVLHLDPAVYNTGAGFVRGGAGA